MSSINPVVFNTPMSLKAYTGAKMLPLDIAHAEELPSMRTLSDLADGDPSYASLTGRPNAQFDEDLSSAPILNDGSNLHCSLKFTNSKILRRCISRYDRETYLVALGTIVAVLCLVHSIALR